MGLKFNPFTSTFDFTGGGSSSGTVTSIAVTVPSFLSVTGSPITTNGTFAISLSGTALPIANGGTGQTTANAALNALLPSQSGNATKTLQTDGTNAAWVALASGANAALSNLSSVAINTTLQPATDGSADIGVASASGSTDLRFGNTYSKNWVGVGAPNQAFNTTRNFIGLDAGTVGTDVYLQAYVNASNSGYIRYFKNGGAGGTWSIYTGGVTPFSLDSNSVSITKTLSTGNVVMNGQISFFNDLWTGSFFGYNGTAPQRPGAVFCGGLAPHRKTVADAAYTVISTNYLIAYTSLTAARVVTLPTSQNFMGGASLGTDSMKQLVIKDESGSCSGINTITITPSGTETIDGVNASVTITTAYGIKRLYADGNGHWFTW